MTNINTETLDDIAKAVGVHNFLDSILVRLDSQTVQDILIEIIIENGLDI